MDQNNNNSRSNSRPRNIYHKQVSKPLTSFTFQENVQTPLMIQDEHQVIETDPLVTQKIYKYLSSLPPGYRFKPTDVELIRDYLQPKIANKPLPLCLIHSVNLYRFHPRTLAEKYLKHPDGEDVFYFTPRDRKYKNGTRPRRGVDGYGYWKATGSDGKITVGDNDEVIIGFTKTLVFYEGKAPVGKKTNWIMHEYRTCESRKRTSSEDMKLDDWVLCKIREKEETVSSKNKNKNKNKNNNEEADDTTNTENANADANAVGNATIDANAVKEEKDNCCPNTNDCGTSYQNNHYRSHQDMGFLLPHDCLYPLNTFQNLNVINYVNYPSGIFSDELSCVPGTSYSNSAQTNRGKDFIEQWEHALRCYNSFDCEPCNFQDGSSNFQDGSSGLNIKDVKDQKKQNK